MEIRKHFPQARAHELPYCREMILVFTKEMSRFFGQGWKLFSGPSCNYAEGKSYCERITLVR